MKRLVIFLFLGCFQLNAKIDHHHTHAESRDGISSFCDRITELAINWPKNKNNVPPGLRVVVELLHVKYASGAMSKAEFSSYVKEIVSNKNRKAWTCLKKFLNAVMYTSVASGGVIITIIIGLLLLEYFPTGLIPYADDAEDEKPNFPPRRKHTRILSGISNAFHSRAGTFDFENVTKELDMEREEARAAEEEGYISD